MKATVKSYVPATIKTVGSGTEKALLQTAIKVTSQAKLLAPVDTGQLRGSIMWKTEKNDGGNTEGPKLSEQVRGLSAIVGTAVEHGVHQEFGTRKMTAQSFLRLAVAIITAGNKAERDAAMIMFQEARSNLRRK